MGTNCKALKNESWIYLVCAIIGLASLGIALA